MTRVCPHSDAECKHGMSCPYTCATDAYDGTKTLLPPAPDGATEGSWRLVPVEPTAEMLAAGTNAPVPDDRHGDRHPKGVSYPIKDNMAIAAYRAMLAASPSVSPVGPKEDLSSYSASEEAAPGGATASWRDLGSAPRDGTPILCSSRNHDACEVVCWAYEPEEGWVNSGSLKDRFYANPLWFTHWMPLPNPPASVSPLEGEGKPPSGATYAENPSSQPTQTGEENAGLVAAWSDARVVDLSQDVPWLQVAAMIAVGDRLALLASRSPIPGELKAMARAIYETRSRVRHPGDPHTTWATWEQCCDLPGWLDWQLAIAQACWDASPGPSALNHLKAVHEWDQSYGRALPDRLAAQIGQTLREALRQTPHQGDAT